MSNLKKKYFLSLILFVYISTNLFSQIITGFVKDSISGNPIIYSNIVFSIKNVGVYSDEKGFFEINLNKNKKDTLLFSAIGFKTKKLSLFHLKYSNKMVDILLSPDVISLDEVVISSSEKNKYKNEYLGEKKEGNVSMSSLIGNQIVSYVKNPFNKSGKIEVLTLYLNRVRKAKSIAKLNIKIYRYDSINDKPSKLISTENIIIKPKNKKYKQKIDLSKYHLPFPKEGICIGIEYISLDNSLIGSDKIGPALRFTYSKNKNNTWFGYRDKGWNKSFLDRKNKRGNLLIGLNVIIPQ